MSEQRLAEIEARYQRSVAGDPYPFADIGYLLDLARGRQQAEQARGPSPERRHEIPAVANRAAVHRSHRRHLDLGSLPVTPDTRAPWSRMIWKDKRLCDMTQAELIDAVIESQDLLCKQILAAPPVTTDGWQPISTWEGIDYALLMSPAHGRVIGAHVTGDVWHLVGVGAVTSQSERPTHWMPLPPSPPADAPQEKV